MSPQAKKGKAKAKAKPPEQDITSPEDRDEDDDVDLEDSDDDGEQGVRERRRPDTPESMSELSIRIRYEEIEVTVPRDGNEADTFRRIADLVEDF